MEIEAIISEIKSHGVSHVCITGGEPLLQKNILTLMTLLCDSEFVVSLETSGSKSIAQVDPRVKIVLDVKTPDSGAKDSFIFENIALANSNTEFKFVICSDSDFDWSEAFCRQHEISKKWTVLFSPSYGKINEQWLAHKILAKKLNVRLQLQLHKYIWLAETRGV